METRECALPTCDIKFIPKGPNHFYHSKSHAQKGLKKLGPQEHYRVTPKEKKVPALHRIQELRNSISHCQLCGDKLTDEIGSRQLKSLDHMHVCPRGHASHHRCPSCVRGILCQLCNADLGGMERLLLRVGAKRVEEYLQQRPLQDST